MSSEPTRGAQEHGNSWKRSAFRVWAVRIVVHLVPLIGSWLAVRSVSGYLLRPQGNAGLVIWASQALLVAGVSAAAIERVSRRLLPLAFMFELTLDFPDKAPSRFKVAMKAGTVKKLSGSTHMQKMLDRSDGENVAETALAMVAAMGRHDRLTRGHVERVRAYADVIAEQMGLSDADRNSLAWGVLLHDIGKLAVPYEVLNKKEKLTDDEWKILQSHPAQGERLIAPLTGFLGEWSLAASQHHERWDGGGYPLGLAGKEISLAGRITSVADAYDVITAKRSYKKPMSHVAAREELVRCSGSQFDPDVVRAMLGASVGRQWRTGPFAWLAEVPGVLKLGQAVTSVPGAVAASGLAATVVIAPSIPPQIPEAMAFVDTLDQAPDSTTLSKVPTSLVAIVLDETELSDERVTVAGIPGERSPTTRTSDTQTSELTSSTVSSTKNTVPTPTTSNTARTSSPTTTTTQSTTTTARPTTTTTQSTTTTATAPTTTSTLPTDIILLYLSNPGAGNTVSSPELGLDETDHDTWHLHNYDTDRNPDVGLTIKKDGAGVGGSDLTKLQDWVYTFDTQTNVSGNIEVSVWVRPDDSDDEDIGFEAQLQLCSPFCTTLGTGQWAEEDLSSWTRAKLSLGFTDFTAQPGDTLRLRIAVPDDISENDLRFAYDTVWADSKLRIG